MSKLFIYSISVAVAIILVAPFIVEMEDWSEIKPYYVIACMYMVMFYVCNVIIYINGGLCLYFNYDMNKILI